MSTECKGKVNPRDNTIPYYPNSVIMKGRPSNVSDDYVLVFDKLDKTKTFKLDISLLTQKCVPNGCFVPKFVDQINDKLFAQIEGVVDFNFKGSEGLKSGHLLLLNIEGRPMYCFTIEDEDISKEVRHKILLFY